MVVLRWVPLVSASHLMVTGTMLGAQDRVTLAVAAAGDSEHGDRGLSAIDLDERDVWLMRRPPGGRSCPEVLRVPVSRQGDVGAPQAMLRGPPSADALTCVAKSLLELAEAGGLERSLLRVLSADLGQGQFPDAGGCDAVLAMSSGLSPEILTLQVGGEDLSQLGEWTDACDALLSRVLGDAAGLRAKHGCHSRNVTERLALRELIVSFAAGGGSPSALPRRRLRLIRVLDAGAAGTFAVADQSWDWPPRAFPLLHLASQDPLLV